jgi:hypothetical protein
VTLEWRGEDGDCRGEPAAGARTSEIALCYGLIATSSTIGGASFTHPRLPMSALSRPIRSGDGGKPGRFGRTAIETEIGGATLRVGGRALLSGQRAAPVEGHKMLIATRPVWC